MIRGKTKIAILMILMLTSGAFLSTAFTVRGAVGTPKILSYQGRLANSSGTLLGSSSGTNYYFKFSVYDAASAGTKLWPSGSPSSMTASVVSGVFNVGVGDTSAGGDTLDLDFNNDTYYLEVQVSSDNSSFETLTPRQRIFSSGYSINADTVDGSHAGIAGGNVLKITTGGNISFGGDIYATSTGGSLFASSTIVSTGNILGYSNLNIYGTGTSTFSGKVEISGRSLINGSSICTAGNGICSASSAGGWTDDGAVVRLTTITDLIGIGTTTPGAKLGVQGIGLFSGNVRAANITATGTITTLGSATSTFTGGLTVGAGGLASSKGLTVTGGVLRSSVIEVNTASASSTWSDGIAAKSLSSSNGLTLTGGIIRSSGIFNITGTATSTMAGGLSASTGGLATSDGVAITGGAINFAGDSITDLVGTGLQVTGGALTLNATGDWTGTFDGQEGTYYLARANHTGTQAASTVTGGTFGAGNFVFPADLLVTQSLNATSTLHVTGTSTLSALLLSNARRLGIGSTTPAREFSVNGSAYLTGGGLGVGNATTTSGVLETSGLAYVGGVLKGASYATFAGTGTSTFAGGVFVDALQTNLPSCDTLDTNASGAIICGTDATGSATFPFTTNTWGNSTSTTLGFLNGFIANGTGSSTLSEMARFTSGIYASSTLYSSYSGTSTFLGGLAAKSLSSTNGLTLTGGVLRSSGIINLTGSATSTFAGGLSITAGGLNFALPSCSGTSALTTDASGGVVCGAVTLSAAGGWTDDGTVVRLTTATDLVGIGTTTPWKSAALGIELNGRNPVFVLGDADTGTQASTSPIIIVNARGHVGFGTTSPWGLVSIAANNDNGVPNFGWNMSNEPLFVVDGGGGVSASKFVVGRSIDASGSYVGIGTTTPSGVLSISSAGGYPMLYIDDQGGNDTSPFVVDTDGSVGIGGKPTSNLGGDLSIMSASSPYLTFQGKSDSIASQGSITFLDFYAGAASYKNVASLKVIAEGTAEDAASIVFGTSPTGGSVSERLRITNMGLVGIGTTSPANIMNLSAKAPAIFLSDTQSSVSAKHWFISNNSNSGFFSIGTTTNTFNATSTYFSLSNRGYLGVGSTTPSQAFSITGSGYLTGGLGVGNATTTSGVLETSGLAYVGGVLKGASYATFAGTGTSTFAGGVFVDALQTNLPSCDSVDTNASGALVCGTDATGGGSGVPNLIYRLLGATKYYTASSSASDNLAWHFDNGFVSSASSSIAGNLRLDGTLLGAGTFTLTGSGTSTLSGGLSVGSGGLASSKGLTITGGAIQFGGDTLSDFTGTGLQNTGGALTLNATGDWTGTIDGNDFAGGAIGVGELIYGGSAGSFSELAAGTKGNVLMFGAGGLPLWQATSTLAWKKDTATSTFDSGLAVGAGGLASSKGLTLTGGVIRSSGIINLTGSATSTFAGGLSVTAGGINFALPSCNTSNALTTDAGGGIVCGAISAGGWTDNGTYITLGTAADQVNIGGSVAISPAVLSVEATSTTATALLVRGNAGQATNLISFQNSGANNLFIISATDKVGIGTSTILGNLPAYGFGVGTSTYIAGGLGIGNATSTSGVLETSSHALIGGTLHVAGSATSTFTGGIAGASLSSTNGITVTGGVIRSSGIINLTGSATSTFAGGLSITAGGLNFALPSCSGTSALTTDASGGVVCGAVTLSAAGGWTDDGTVVRLTTATDLVGIGTTTPGRTVGINGKVFFDSAEIRYASSTAQRLTFSYQTSATSTIVASKKYAWTIATSTTGAPLFSISTFNNKATTTLQGGFEIENDMRITSRGNIAIGTTSPRGYLSIDKFSGMASTTYNVAGIDSQLKFNLAGAGTQIGNKLFVVNAPTSHSNTLVGSLIKIADNTTLANTVRGLEVQAHLGTNTQGEHTAIAGFGRTFGVRGSTEGDAGGVLEPAGLFGETRGTTQGNAIRGYTNSLTSGALTSLFQETSAFTGNGLQMNFGGSGSFTGKFASLQNNSKEVWNVRSTGSTTIGTSTATRIWTLTVQGGVCITSGNGCPTAEVNGGLRVDTAGVAAGDDPGDVFDIAERYPASQIVEAGDILMIDMATTSKAYVTQAIASSSPLALIGIVSTRPALAINGSDLIIGAPKEATSTNPLVALAGRVPVKVALPEGEHIKKGDRIGPSDIPGVGKKAEAGGSWVGIALENYAGANNPNGSPVIGKVLVLVNLGHGVLDSQIARGTLHIGSSTINQFSGAFEPIEGSLNLLGADITNVRGILSAAGTWSIDEQGNLKVVSIETDQLKVGSREKPSGITLYDTENSMPYCLYIRSGAPQTVSGSCEDNKRVFEKQQPAPQTQETEPLEMPPEKVEPPKEEQAPPAVEDTIGKNEQPSQDTPPEQKEESIVEKESPPPEESPPQEITSPAQESPPVTEAPANGSLPTTATTSPLATNNTI